MPDNILITLATLIFTSFLTANCSTVQISQQEKSTETSSNITVSTDSIPYQRITCIENKARFFTTDKLRNFYVVNSKNELQKYSPEGQLLFNYTNNRAGEISFVDATNPFNILVFYPDYLQLVTLNRTLNPTGEINLNDFGFQEVRIMAMSNDNNIWIYDELRFRLKKLSRDGRVVQESEDLSMLLPEAFRPDFMMERGNYLYINNPETGIHIFDVFGDFVRTIPLKNLQDFQVLDEQLVYQSEGQLTTLHPETLLKRSMDLPAVCRNKAVRIRLQKDRLYVQDEGTICLYGF